MTKPAAAKPRPRQKRARNESALYDGSALLGRLIPVGDRWTARDSRGQKIGEFVDERAAVRAIHRASRAMREELSAAGGADKSPSPSAAVAEAPAPKKIVRRRSAEAAHA